MKAKETLFWSLGLNAALLFLMVLLRPDGLAPAPVSCVKVVTNVVHRTVRSVVSQSPLPTNSAAQFHWRSVESGDYPTYVANLRRLGCPEKTIRDLIEAEIRKLYAARRMRIEDESGDPFWQNGSQRAAAAHVRRLKLRELDEEERIVVPALLGGDETWVSRADWQADGGEASIASLLLGNLPEELQGRIFALYKKYQRVSGELNEDVDGLFTPEDRARQRELYVRQQTEFVAVLGPVGMEELRARLAALDGAHVKGVNATVRQVRQIFVIKAGISDPFRKLFDLDDEEATPERDRQREEQIKLEVGKLLGKQGFADYERAQNSNFRQIFDFAEEMRLPKSVAIGVFEVRLVAEQQSDQVRSDSSLDASQRREALEAVQAAAERAVANVLGANAYRIYRTNAGVWLLNLVPPASTSK